MFKKFGNCLKMEFANGMSISIVLESVDENGPVDVQEFEHAEVSIRRNGVSITEQLVPDAISGVAYHQSADDVSKLIQRINWSRP